MSGGNEALWLLSPKGRFEVRPTPHPTAGPGEVVIRVRAVAVNPVDAITGPLRRLVTPWVRWYVTVLERVCTPIPDDVSYEHAAVLPLGLSTAAAGLFEHDQLALPLPTASTQPRGDVVLVWGASTSVGSNAVQLARAGGFVVLATAGRKNHEFVRSLGADTVVDYRDTDVDQQIIDAVGDRRLAGTIAIGQGSLTHALRIAGRTSCTKRIASAYPDPVTRTRALIARTRGIHVSGIWGGTPVVSPVGPAIFRDFLPAALQDRRFRPAPEPVVTGTGLAELPNGHQE